jgi:type II secretory pathway component GspD/PulD (secretin)
MKTVARARVFALDNQSASIQSGQRVATVASVNRMGIASASGAKPSYSYTFQNVGTLMGFTPRINAKDGTVVLQIDAEDSQILPDKKGDTGADKEEFRPTETGTLTLQTTVAIPDGKTIMLGSIGRQGKDDKELVIVLTPHIIGSEDAKKTGH